MNKKYQVFISSTYSDLIEQRKKALDILLMADCIPAGMEAFVATDDEQFNVIKKVIDLCDYYILIIGKRYGTINKATGLSYTEMEYDYAKEKNIPILVFALDDSVEMPIDKMETETEKIENLKIFKEKAMKNRLASPWKTPDDLYLQMSISIMKAKIEIKRPGWQRAVDYDELSLNQEILELRNKNIELETKLKDANKTIESFTIQNNLAFENCKIKIDYYYINNNNKIQKSIVITLKKIFSIVSTQMLDVAITEQSILNSIIFNLISKNNKIYLNDNQLIKRILNQFKSLDLITSYWSAEKSVLFWKLTKKGKKVRDDIILIKSESNN